MGTQSVATVHNNTDCSVLSGYVKRSQEGYIAQFSALTHQEAAQHQPVKLTADINWLCIWEAVPIGAESPSPLSRY